MPNFIIPTEDFINSFQRLVVDEINKLPIEEAERIKQKMLLAATYNSEMLAEAQNNG